MGRHRAAGSGIAAAGVPGGAAAGPGSLRPAGRSGRLVAGGPDRAVVQHTVAASARALRRAGLAGRVP